MPSKFKLRKGRVVVFGNSDYTNANITDEVAMKMIASNVKNAGNFENPDEVLEAYHSQIAKGSETVVVIENKATVEANEYQPKRSRGRKARAK